MWCVLHHLFDIISESSRFFIERDYKPMKFGETRTFEVPKDKVECKVRGQKIMIEKTRKASNIKFVVIPESAEFKNEAYLVCLPGNIDFMVTGNLEGCGIGKMLTKLCINEEKIHNVEMNKDIQAIKDIQRKLDELSDANKKELAKLEKWANKECSRIVYLYMNADPKDNAYVYFNSFLESGWSHMSIVDKDNGDIYPKFCFGSVQELKIRYDDGYMVHGEEKINVLGSAWIFCLPKAPTTQSRC